MKKLILFISLISLSLLSQASIWMVDSLNDSGTGSLRAAADSAGAGDVIRFNPNLIANGSDSIVLTTGEIVIDSIAVEIVGLFNATDTLYISGNNSSRIFSFTAADKIILDSLYLINGSAVGDGGAIYSFANTDTFFVVNSIISRNNSTGSGGGIGSLSYSAYSRVYVENSRITENTSGTYGGGIYSRSWSGISTISVNNSTVSNNSAVSGGGIYGYSSNGNTTSHSKIYLTNSTVSANIATTGNGGGIFGTSQTLFSSYNGTNAFSYVTVIGSTITNNFSSAGEGGGIFSASKAAQFKISVSSVIVTNSTIYANGSFIAGKGAISNQNTSSSYYSTTITFKSSIVLGNDSLGMGVYNRTGNRLLSSGYNIFGDSILGVSLLDSVNVTASQLNLQALAYYGGSTQTLMPGIGSMALNKGDPNDNSDAQNISISGRRDVGAAEYCMTTYSTDSIVSCASYYTWIDGKTYIQDNSWATHVVENSAGCDSVIILNLTLPNQQIIDTVHACDSIVWIDGVTYFDHHGLVTDTLTNSNGCDSVVYLHFIPSNYGVDKRSVCDSLVWINGQTYYNSNQCSKRHPYQLFWL